MYSASSGDDTLWLPKSYEDLEMLPPIYKSRNGSHIVVQTGPEVVIKYGGQFSEEIICARFARRNTLLAIVGNANRLSFHFSCSFYVYSLLTPYSFI